MLTRTTTAAALAAWAFLQPVSAPAQSPDALYLASVAATCANCHGTRGQPVPGSALPPLAGMPQEQMLAQLRAFRDGSRPATIMHQLAKGFSDGQLQQLAGWFAAQPR